jgi:hypothetical protein
MGRAVADVAADQVELELVFVSGNVTDMLGERKLFGAADLGQLELASHGGIDLERLDRPVEDPLKRRLTTEIVFAIASLVEDFDGDRGAVMHVMTAMAGIVVIDHPATVDRLLFPVEHNDQVLGDEAVISRDNLENLSRRAAKPAAWALVAYLAQALSDSSSMSPIIR